MASLWKQKAEILERLNLKPEATSAYQRAMTLIEQLPASRKNTGANLKLESQIRAKQSAISPEFSK